MGPQGARHTEERCRALAKQPLSVYTSYTDHMDDLVRLERLAYCLRFLYSLLHLSPEDTNDTSVGTHAPKQNPWGLTACFCFSCSAQGHRVVVLLL